MITWKDNWKMMKFNEQSKVCIWVSAKMYYNLMEARDYMPDENNDELAKTDRKVADAGSETL